MTQQRTFLDYLNAVDDFLEEAYGFTSRQENLDFIANCQEAGASPEECAKQIDPAL